MRKKNSEHVFPFELMEYFELITVKELGDVRAKVEFYEIVFREKDIAPTDQWMSYYEPKGYLNRRLQDFPMMGKPVIIEIQRLQWHHKHLDIKRFRSFRESIKQLTLKDEIKNFLEMAHIHFAEVV